MIKADRRHKSLVVAILTESFDTNKSVNFVVAQDKNRKQRIRHLMSYSFDICYEFGEVLLTDDKKGCALLVYPETKKSTFKSLLRDIKLIFQTIGILNVSKVLKKESIIQSKHPSTPFIYLWYIGVYPNEQSKGIGSEVISYLHELSKSSGKPIYLETSMSKNLQFYSNHGFEIYHELEKPYTIYMLRNGLD